MFNSVTDLVTLEPFVNITENLIFKVEANNNVF